LYKAGKKKVLAIKYTEPPKPAPVKSAKAKGKEPMKKAEPVKEEELKSISNPSLEEAKLHLKLLDEKKPKRITDAYKMKWNSARDAYLKPLDAELHHLYWELRQPLNFSYGQSVRDMNMMYHHLKSHNVAKEYQEFKKRYIEINDIKNLYHEYTNTKASSQAYYSRKGREDTLMGGM